MSSMYICFLSMIFICCFSSHPSHSVPSEAAEAGADQRLPTDGGGVHQKPGADEATGRETGGQTWCLPAICFILD